jgi:hypothetical protein
VIETRCWPAVVAAAGLMVGAYVNSPTALVAQEGAPVEIGGLLRTGFRSQPEETGASDGFEVFDAHVSLGGEIGLVFEYFVRGEFDTEDDVLRLLDARLDFPIIPEANVGFGLSRPYFGLEAMEDEGDFMFLRRAQASDAIAPGRQVGVTLFGEALDNRLTYGGGIYNGNGRTLDNDDGRYMFAARGQFNTIGPIEFYEDLVIQVGASIAYSDDDAAELGPGLVTPLPDAVPLFDPDSFAGERLLLGADFYASYRAFTFRGEYLRGEFDLEEPDDGEGPDDGELDDLDAYGGYIEGSYSVWGALEAVLRYDGFSPAQGESRDFLAVGLNIYPGYYAKIGLQYAFALHDSPPAPTIAGNQFALVVQVDF